MKKTIRQFIKTFFEFENQLNHSKSCIQVFSSVPFSTTWTGSHYFTARFATRLYQGLHETNHLRSKFFTLKCVCSCTFDKEIKREKRKNYVFFSSSLLFKISDLQRIFVQTISFFCIYTQFGSQFELIQRSPHSILTESSLLSSVKAQMYVYFHECQISQTLLTTSQQTYRS